MNILIYTITRNDAHKLDNYYSQISLLPGIFKEHKFYLSIYENDSTDDTVKKLNGYDFSMFEDHKIISEKLNVPFFESVDSKDRIQILANARNSAIFKSDFLDKVDYVMMIESDIKYQPRAVRKLLNFNQTYNLDADVVSSVMLWSELDLHHYDNYGTRITSEDRRSYIRDDWRTKDYDEYWATCNGIALFKAEPFKKGAKYQWFSEKFNTYDCDTVLICEEFRKLGYNNIYINYTSRVYVD